MLGMLLRACLGVFLLVPASAAFCGQPGPREIESMVKRLGAEEYAAREKATEDLRKLGSRARTALEQALDDKDAEIRERAAMLLREILWKLPPKLAERLGPFAARFKDFIKSSDSTKLRLLTGLRSRAPVEAEPYILQAVRELKSNQAQSWIAGLLTIYRGKKAEEILISISRRRDRHCRSSAARGLARSENPAAVKRLLELVDDPDPTVRRDALEALGSRGAYARKHSGLVIKRLDDGDEAVKSAAASAAGHLGDLKALPALWKLVKDRELSVRVQAIRAIGELAPLSDRKHAAKLAELLEDPLPAVRASALSAMLEMKAHSSVPKLVKLLSDGDTDLAASAAQGLASLGGPPQFEALRRTMRESNDTSLAASAASTLIVLGDQESAAEAAALLTGKNAVAASVIARALGSTGSMKWLPALLNAEKHWKAESFTLTVLEIRSVRLRERSALKPLAAKLAARRGDSSWAYFLAQHALFEQAEPILSEVVGTNLDAPGSLSRLGIAQLQAGRAGEGMGKLRRAARMNPLSAINLNNFAWFLLTAPDGKLRNDNEALQAAERAATLAPRTGYILDTYAWALHRNGRSREGLKQLELALQWSRSGNPGEETVLRVHKARMLGALGKPKEALKELSAVLAKFRRDPDLALEAARAYCDLGLPESACGELGRMVELGYPDVNTLRLDPELSRARKSEGFQRVMAAAKSERQRMLTDIAEAKASRKASPKRPLEIIAQ